MFEAAEQEKDEEQENTDRDGGVGEIEDGEVKAYLGNLKEDKIDDVAAMMNSINQISCRSTGNHAEDQLQRQWPRVEDAQVQVHDHGYGNGDEHGQHCRIRKHAEGRAVVLDIIQREIIPDQRYKATAIGRTKILHHQPLRPLIEGDDDESGEQG